MPKQQTYANHIRWYPLVHFVIQPLLIINLVYQSVRLYQEPSWDRGFLVMLSLLFIMMVIASRLQSLRVQDRVIRLEERLRFRELLTEEGQGHTSMLPLSNLLALRFASDEELSGIVDQIATGKLKTSKEIKMAIQNWRADHLRA